MNQRNVDALARVLRDIASEPVREGDQYTIFAEHLASRGCLGPASEVLTEADLKSNVLALAHDSEFGVGADHDDFSSYVEPEAAWLERIAKGETP